MRLTLSIPPGPSLYVEGRAGVGPLLDQLEPHLRAVPGLSVTRQLPERIVAFVGEYDRRDQLVERVRAWCERKGYEVEVVRW